MKRVRIVERTNVDGRIEYVIQQRHFLFRWHWVDAWVNCGVECRDHFNTLEEAKANLCYYDGSKIIDREVMLLKAARKEDA